MDYSSETLSSALSAAIIKHSEQKQLMGEKGFICLALLVHSPSLREVWAGIQAGI